MQNVGNSGGQIDPYLQQFHGMPEWGVGAGSRGKCYKVLRLKTCTAKRNVWTLFGS